MILNALLVLYFCFSVLCPNWQSSHSGVAFASNIDFPVLIKGKLNVLFDDFLSGCCGNLSGFNRISGGSEIFNKISNPHSTEDKLDGSDHKNGPSSSRHLFLLTEVGTPNSKGLGFIVLVLGFSGLIGVKIGYNGLDLLDKDIDSRKGNLLLWLGTFSPLFGGLFGVLMLYLIG